MISTGPMLKEKGPSNKIKKDFSRYRIAHLESGEQLTVKETKPKIHLVSTKHEKSNYTYCSGDGLVSRHVRSNRRADWKGAG